MVKYKHFLNKCIFLISFSHFHEHNLNCLVIDFWLFSHMLESEKTPFKWLFQNWVCALYKIVRTNYN